MALKMGGRRGGCPLKTPKMIVECQQWMISTIGTFVSSGNDYANQNVPRNSGVSHSIPNPKRNETAAE